MNWKSSSVGVKGDRCALGDMESSKKVAENLLNAGGGLQPEAWET